MSEYRIRATGEIKTQQEVCEMYPNVSLPKNWNTNVYENLGIDPVVASSAPDASGTYKKVVRNGIVQNSEGAWVYSWTEEDMSSDETTEHNLSLADEARVKRNDLLESTDHYGLSDVTMSADMATYRQALRDVPQQEGFPQTITWPTKPE